MTSGHCDILLTSLRACYKISGYFPRQECSNAWLWQINRPLHLECKRVHGGVITLFDEISAAVASAILRPSFCDQTFDQRQHSACIHMRNLIPTTAVRNLHSQEVAQPPQNSKPLHIKDGVASLSPSTLIFQMICARYQAGIHRGAPNARSGTGCTTDPQGVWTARASRSVSFYDKHRWQSCRVCCAARVVVC